jgi:hypothetical protein
LHPPLPPLPPPLEDDALAPVVVVLELPEPLVELLALPPSVEKTSTASVARAPHPANPTNTAARAAV